MLGDHRSNSNDGHVWGFTPRQNVVGKAICVFWPPTRLGLVDNMTFHPRAPQQPVSKAKAWFWGDRLIGRFTGQKLRATTKPNKDRFGGLGDYKSLAVKYE